MTLVDEIDRLHRCETLSDLEREYGVACDLFTGDEAALFWVREATYYAKERLKEVPPANMNP